MIVSTTICGPGSEHLISAALASVRDVVDKHVLIWTGEIYNQFTLIYPSAEIFHFPWTGSFADARNFALEKAAEVGADWALTIDTDERLIEGGLPHLYEDDSPDVIMVYDESGSYAKDRLICLPLKPNAKWVGAVHEAFLPGDGARREIFEGWRIRELPKTPEQLKAKFERDLIALEKMTKDEPEDARWWFYLGETQKYLGQLNGATRSFVTCSQLSKWDEEKCWANYRIAESLGGTKRYDDAIATCNFVLRHHPGFAEAAWLAGWCSYQLGRYQHAIYWSRMAKAIAEAEKLPELRRIGFRHLPAYQDGPQSVEDWAWKKLKGTEP